ncbi:MAG: hypothetical protein MUF83_14260 [Acidimicrobiales bacterium]|jgi:hypothetical protein|nr:hypothetical protein [Acidimicrobiales bacterium]
MAERGEGPGYGQPNWALIGRWLELPADEDGPFWALNLMRYRAVAAYRDGRATTLSGREADDAYAPLGPLAAVGAVVAFAGDVDTQLRGTPTWDRVAIARYPSRAAFFAMQQRDDFKDQHEHKIAGMAFTINAATHPTAHDPSAPTTGRLVLSVTRSGPAAPAAPDGVALVAHFAVEGVVLGDDRTWDHVRFDRVADDEALAALCRSIDAADEAVVVTLTPTVDHLIESIETAPGARP